MPFPKKLLYYGLLAALTLLAVEGMARAAYWLAFGEGYGRELTGGAAAVSPEGEAGWNALAATRIRQPFYGHTPIDPGHYLNAGPPPVSSEAPVVIGLVGGSVAHDLLPYFSRAVYRYFSDNNLARRPAVLGLGYLSMKQPQPVMVVAEQLARGGRFDLIVNLDGYNEIFFSGRNYREGVFPFYPYQWSALTGLTAAETLRAGRIGVLREEQAELRRAAAAHPLRASAVFGLFNRYGRERVAGQIVQLNAELTAGRADYIWGRHGPRGQWRTEGDWYPAVAPVWYRSSLALAELADLAGAEYYHFLQPNQYLPGSKPLSAAELACCYTDAAFREGVYRAVYPRIAEWGEGLQQRAVNYFDLTQIFQGNRETLYGDECCHLNARGNELLAAAIVERLEPALVRAAAGEPAVSGLAAARPPPPAMVAEELLMDAEFSVYRRGGRRLVYVKEPCSGAELEAPFFLHITPANRDNLPAERRAAGFENWDFQFERGGGGVINGRCRVERPLPPYPIASIRTGQFTPGGGTLWAAEYPFER